MNRKVIAYNGRASILPDMDFETYSEAGFVWDPIKQKWHGLTKTTRGIAAVGAPAYSEHPSTRVISLAYDLKDGVGGRLWLPGCPLPVDLFAHIAAGGLIEAHNSGFERYIWQNVCVKRLGWPTIPLEQYRCSMAKCYSFSLPGKLEKAAEIMGATEQKDKRGEQLIRLLSVPKNPTKADPSIFRTPEAYPSEFDEFYDYNLQDIRAEASLSQMLPDLSPYEQQLWVIDQRINDRGVHIDRQALDDCIAVVEETTERLTAELQRITGGAVATADELQKILGWLAGRGLNLPSLDADTVDATLAADTLPPGDQRRRVLEIRSSLGARSVKKLYSIRARLSSDGRLRDLFAFCGADRTGRWAGRGPQPQNLPSSGPAVALCACGCYYWAEHKACPHCGAVGDYGAEWGAPVVDQALDLISARNVDEIMRLWGDPVALVSGCLRGLFCAAPGHDLICSDFSAIEAVVLAALAGCEWRLEVFRTHGKIYEMSASKISGVPFEEFQRYKAETGNHHPLRKKIGKVAELASGYQGWIGAWKNFGADKHLTDDEIKAAILAWRDASPEIPALWKGLEEAFTNATLMPGRVFTYRGISYGVMQDVMFCRLPSGRCLTYHRPRAEKYVDQWNREKWRLSYEGHNSDYKKGPVGWLCLETYGGKLTENVVQAVARDIQANAIMKLDGKYPIVLHVHDEGCSEVPAGFGSVEEYEATMQDLPAWCADWPIRAAGGWRGKRYRKD